MKRTQLVANVLWALSVGLCVGVGVLLVKGFALEKNKVPVNYQRLIEEALAASEAQETRANPRDHRDFETIWKTTLGEAQRPAAAAVPSGPPLESLLRVLGTTVHVETPERSSCFLEFVQQSGNVERKRIGESISAGPGDPYTISEIKERSVVFTRGAERVELPVMERGGAAAPALPAAAAARQIRSVGLHVGNREPGGPKGGASGTASYVDPANPHYWHISQQEREYILASEEQLAQQVKVRPFMPSGDFEGILVEDVQPGSIFAQRGLRPQDIIRKVNGQPITSMEHAGAVYDSEKQKGASSVTVEILRNGAPVSLRYDLIQ